MSIAERLPPRLRADLALLAVTFVWGMSFTVVKSALDDASTVVFLAIRFVTAVLAVAWFSRRHLRTGSLADPLAWRGGPWAGLCLAVAYLAQTSGLRETTASKSAFITSLCTALVPFFGALVYKSVPRPGELIGVALAILGMGFLTVIPQQLEQGFGAFDIARGELLTLAGAAAFAAHILVTGHFAGRAGLSAFSLLQLATAALLFLLVLPWLGPPVLRLTPRLAGAVLLTSVLCTAVGFTVQAWAQRHTTPTRAGLIFATEPVSAAATSYLVAGETLPAAGWVGAALIVTGVIAVELKPAPGRGHPSG